MAPSLSLESLRNEHTRLQAEIIAVVHSNADISKENDVLREQLQSESALSPRKRHAPRHLDVCSNHGGIAMLPVRAARRLDVCSNHGGIAMLPVRAARRLDVGDDHNGAVVVPGRAGRRLDLEDGFPAPIDTYIDFLAEMSAPAAAGVATLSLTDLDWMGDSTQETNQFFVEHQTNASYNPYTRCSTVCQLPSTHSVVEPSP